MAIVLFVINSKKTKKQFEGLKLGLTQFIKTAMVIVGAFILAGFIEVLIPGEFVQGWLSREAGLKGVVLGTFGGMLLAVGPYAFFPIVSSITASGAGLGTIISMITGWTLLGLGKMPYETAFVGVEFFYKKLLYSIPFSLLAGLIAFVLEIVVY
ncbi:hypothetical protein [Gudongella sp. DL1XJH-153]|uniref:hypothetical protein n=1 Tax=Gudongella sp. DL1XJH-153 TaxID=3409804 RepID=UPI003BB810F9